MACTRRASACGNSTRLLVVEGYMDVVALAQYDINYAVATLGTATTPEHLERLFRADPEVVFCFDGDRAGRAAAWRALETALPILREGRQARFLFLPDGEDPDSLVRKEGRERFEARLAERHAPVHIFLRRTWPSRSTPTASMAAPVWRNLPDRCCQSCRRACSGR